MMNTPCGIGGLYAAESSCNAVANWSVSKMDLGFATRKGETPAIEEIKKGENLENEFFFKKKTLAWIGSKIVSLLSQYSPKVEDFFFFAWK